MVRKIFKSGNSLVVSLPKESLQMLGLEEGSAVSIRVDANHNHIVIAPEQQTIEIDAEFFQQLNDFIEQYRPALEALAK